MAPANPVDDDMVFVEEEGDEVNLRFNLESKEFQESLRRDYLIDPLVFCRMARDNPDLTDWIVQTFGAHVLADMDQLDLKPEDEGEGHAGLVQDKDNNLSHQAGVPRKPVNKSIFARLKKALASAASAGAVAATTKQTVARSKSKIGDKLAVATATGIKIGNRAQPRCSHKVKAGPPDESRLLDTTMVTDDGRIHMMLAVTQGLINNRLKYLWALEEEMRSIHVTLDSGEEIKSYLLPPKIHLEIETNKPGSAVYWMMFDYGGHIKILDSKAEGGYRIYPTDGWKFAFDVDIALQGVDPDSDEFNEVKGKLGSDGDFRVSRLLADFQIAAADIMNPRVEFCYFGDQTLEYETSESLKLLLNRWRDQAIENGLGIIGWGVTTDNPASIKKLPPTFSPTDQQLQTYPYMEKGQKSPIIGLDDPRANYNMLLYLNMTDSKPFPKDRFLDYSGNWCTPIAPVQAPKPPEISSTLCIGKDVFFNNFVIPHLTLLNRASWVEAKEPGVEFKGGGIVIHWNKVFGGRDLAFYEKWKPISGTRNAGTATEKWFGWQWKNSTRGYQSRQKTPLGRGTGEMKTEVSNTIIIVPAKNVIEVEHRTWVYMRTEHRRIKNRHGISEIERKGTIKITVESVLDGQNLRLDFPTPPDLFKTEVTRYENDFIGKRDTIERERDQYKDALNNSKDFKDAVSKIEKALESVGAFVIPTGGTFFLRDALFNDECDLLLKASYNGVD